MRHNWRHGLGNEINHLAAASPAFWSNAYSIPLPQGTTTDPEVLARFIFSQSSRWVSGLMAVHAAQSLPYWLAQGIHNMTRRVKGANNSVNSGQWVAPLIACSRQKARPCAVHTLATRQVMRA